MGPANKKQRLSNGNAAAITQLESDAAENPPITDASASPATKKESAEQQKRSLFVRLLPNSTTTESLTALFSDSYPVKHATAVTDPTTKECRGYGFVTFADAEDAARAKEEFNGHVIDGRKIRVEIAEPRQRDGEGPGKVARPEKPLPQPAKLIVRNLPWSIKGSEQLTKLFLSYGKVKQAYVPKKGPGLMSGFGFVIMRGRKNAEKALEGVNGKEIDGRTLAVDWAVEKDAFQGASEPEPADESQDAATSVQNGDEDDSLDNSDEDDGYGAEAQDYDASDDSEGGDVDGDGESVLDDDDDDDEEDNGVGLDVGEESEHLAKDRSCTLFIRNLPFTCSDEDLEDHFSQFGATRYARVVMDRATERSKGTGFICFYKRDDADECLKNAPKRSADVIVGKSGKDAAMGQQSHSILQNDLADPSGRYSLDGRVLQVTRAVDKSEANKFTEEGINHRYRRDNDKRRLFLLSEGTISSKSTLWDQLPPSEKAMREASLKQRKALIESNPSLHLSLTRLSVRNLPRSIGSKELKSLAREAVVGFATDVKAGSRQKLSKEETSRGGEEMVEIEKSRKKAGKGIVKQAKVVFEGSGGGKVAEDTGAGRSRGYGFIEYYTHRNALMGLRWLNGHAIGYQVNETDKKAPKLSREDVQDRKKRLIVEFAIENAQVVLRRTDREQKARSRSQAFKEGRDVDGDDSQPKRSFGKFNRRDAKSDPRKRKREPERLGSSRRVSGSKSSASQADQGKSSHAKAEIDEKLARRNNIIGRKRAMRKNRKGGKA